MQLEQAVQVVLDLLRVLACMQREEILSRVRIYIIERLSLAAKQSLGDDWEKAALAYRVATTVRRG
jgi:hypothetical protein